MRLSHNILCCPFVFLRISYLKIFIFPEVTVRKAGGLEFVNEKW